MLRPFSLVVVALLAWASLAAQQVQTPLPLKAANSLLLPQGLCATDLFLTGQRKSDRFRKAEEAMNRAILRHARVADVGIITLPVVFHIVGDAPNLFSDAQVQTAIQDLNDAFGKGGAYAGSLGADTKIRFCLAKKAPDGGLTNGITRTVSFFGTDLNPVTEDAKLKNLVQWDPSRYINIWYVKNMHLEINARFQCGNWLRLYAGGYATLPPGGGPTDGIVVTALGTMLAHEMGHYLGLYHTFEGLDCRNYDCTTEGDRVCDTPPDASMGNAPACNLPDNSCNTDSLSGFATNVPDRIDNFMDYGNESCHNAFTQGQADRMRAAIATQRSGLLQDECTTPCTDAVAASFLRDNAYPLPGEPIGFTNTSTGATRYEWLVDGVLSSVNANFSIAFGTAGKHKVTLKAYGNADCFSSFSHDVIVTCGVTARFFTDKREISVFAPKYLDSIRFTNNSVNGTSFLWLMSNNINMAEQVVSTSKDFTYVFTAPGNYLVRLVATNGACTDTSAFFPITVNNAAPDGVLYVTSADCYQETKLRVSFYVCNYGYGFIPKGTPISFYDADPKTAGAKKLATFLLPDIIPGLCCGYLLNTILDVGYRKLNRLYGVFNDGGTTTPLVLPNTGFQEKEYNNNTSILTNFAFRVSAVPASSVLENGDTIQLKAQAFPNPASFVWTPAKGLSCTSCSSPFFVADSSTTRQVIATSNYGCTDTAVATIQVPPYNDFTLRIDDVQCSPNDSIAVTFTIRNSFKRPTIPQGLTVALYNGDPMGSRSVFLPPLFSVPATVNGPSATYTTIVKSRGTGKIYGGVNDSGKVLPPLIPSGNFSEKEYGNNLGSFIYNGFSIAATPPSAVLEWGDTLQLTAVATPAPIRAYNWSNAGGLSCASCQSPLFVADTSTTKKVSGENMFGCIDTAIVTLKVPPYNDFTAAVAEVQCARGDSLYVRFSVANGFKRGVLPKNLSVSFYNGDPTKPGAILLKPVFTIADTVFQKAQNYATFIKGMPAGNLYVVVNDNGVTAPVLFPASPLLEKEYTNNVSVFAYKPETLQVSPADTTVFRKRTYQLHLGSTVYNASSTSWQSVVENPLSCTLCREPLIYATQNAVAKVQTENVYGCLLQGEALVKIFPPDLQVTVLDTKCFTNDTALVTFRVCMNNGYDSVWKNIPVAFYDDVAGSGNLLPSVFYTPQITAGNCAVFTTKIRSPKNGKLVAVVNDKGDNQGRIPNKLFDETNLSNNSFAGNYTPFEIDIVPADTTVERLTSLQLSTQAKGGTVSAYLWSPLSALSCRNCASPFVTPPYTTELELKAQNEYACTSTAHAVVRTHSQEGVYIPTAFSPNRDGKNDILYVIAGAEVKELKSFALYDRWGQEVFHVQGAAPNTPQFGWSGRIGNAEAPPAVYVYLVVVKKNDGSEKTYKGTVTLIR